MLGLLKHLSKPLRAVGRSCKRNTCAVAAQGRSIRIGGVPMQVEYIKALPVPVLQVPADKMLWLLEDENLSAFMASYLYARMRVPAPAAAKAKLVARLKACTKSGVRCMDGNYDPVEDPLEGGLERAVDGYDDLYLMPVYKEQRATKEELISFWRSQGVEHVIPHTGGRYPEGWDPCDTLKKMAGERSVLEFGCGYGRLCGSFSPKRYVGVDVNPNALAQARAENPGYTFVPAEGNRLPRAEVAFTYTVLLHINDDVIQEYVDALAACADEVIVAELMDRRWRRPSDPPVFCRDPETYIMLFARAGMALAGYEKKAYVRYVDTDLAHRKDDRMTFLRFRKATKGRA